MTSYNTIQLPQEEPKRNTAKKVATFGAVFAAVVVMFFAGRVYQESANPYTHVEVMNLAEMCDEGSYIGGCVACKTCAAYEYANGGCSFFKDTFCSYCEPIANCKRENIECTDRTDQKCNQCDCDDPVSQWTDVEVEELDTRGYLYSEDSTSMSCYFGEDCTPCRVCPKGSFQTAECTQTVDTQCQLCSECSDDQFVATPCSYDSNTVCEDCYHCDADGLKETTENACVRWAENPSVHFQGSQTVCKACAEVQEGSYVTSVCSENSDTQQEVCRFCDDGEWPETFCQSGEILLEGADTICAACTPGAEGFYETYKCDKLVSRDAEFAQCTTCILGEWMQEECHDIEADGSIHASPADTICPTCTDIPNCQADVTSCESGEDQQCDGCVKTQTINGVWDDCCDEGFHGMLCEYQVFDASCGTNSYRQRNAQSMKFFKEYVAEQNIEFVKQCKLMCDEFSDCIAFEVEDAVLAEGAQITNFNTCDLKNTGSVLEELAGADDDKTCFYNLHRHPQE